MTRPALPLVTVLALATIWLLPQAAAGASVSVTTSPTQSGIAELTPARGATTSGNWSGYAAQASNAFTAAAGSWDQPAAKCTSPTEATRAAFWVGLDGYSDQTVEQIGTQANCADGSPVYFAWWQMYPSPFVRLPESSYPVAPGDKLTATVTRSGTSYVLALTSSAGWKYSTVQTGDGADSSAEWVASSPPLCATCDHFSQLTDFGKVSFTGARAAAGGKLRPVSAYRDGGGPHEITMNGAGGVTRAKPSSLACTGDSFSITWEHA